MTAGTLLLFLLGFVLLLGGAELLVRGSSRLAQAVGISPLVVGLTVVAFGTSSPEIAVSVNAVRSGTGDLAFGNVIGSNIANVLLVLGISATVAPLVVDPKLVRRDVPLMILAALLVAAFALDGAVGRWDALVLLALLTGWTVFTVRASRAEVRAERERAAAAGGEGAPPEPTRRLRGIVWNVLVAAAGFGMLVYGSDLLVEAAVAVAAALGVSELVIGLTIVAVGTSLPEVATSAMATWRGEREIAVGNVVGSNLFNLLAVLGAAGVVDAAGVPVHPRAMAFDVPVMLGCCAVCLPVFFTGGRISRGEGVLFLSGYGAYVLWLVLDAAGSPGLATLRDGLLYVGLPVVVVALAASTWREWRSRRTPGDG